MKILATLLSSALLLFAFSDRDIEAESMATIDGVPWAIEFIDDKNLLITEKSGKLYRLDTTTKTLTPIEVPFDVLDYGQGGFMDVVTSPSFAKTHELYFTYAKDGRRGAFTTLAKATLQGDRLTNPTDLLETKSYSSTGRHFGSRIAFDKDEYIYFGVGDRGVRENGQNPKTHAGSLLKVDSKGDAPKDNPFVAKSTALDEIYSYGHRNPQGIAYDEQKNILYVVEHGPRGGDEINIIQKGGNYGWAEYSYGKEYYADIEVGERPHKGEAIEPVKIYDPSIAPSSMYLYKKGVFRQLENSLLIGALVQRHLNIILLDENGMPKEEIRVLEGINERIRDVTADSKGYIYISTDSGKIIKLKPSQTQT